MRGRWREVYWDWRDGGGGVGVWRRVCWMFHFLLAGFWLLAGLAVSTTTLPDIDRAQASGSDWRMVPPPPPLNFVVLVLVEMHD
jgi:hypothetical protein